MAIKQINVRLQSSALSSTCHFCHTTYLCSCISISMFFLFYIDCLVVLTNPSSGLCSLNCINIQCMIHGITRPSRKISSLIISIHIHEIAKHQHFHTVRNTNYHNKIELWKTRKRPLDHQKDNRKYLTDKSTTAFL